MDLNKKARCFKCLSFIIFELYT